MAQPVEVMAFRKRLKKRGYTDISISWDTDQEVRPRWEDGTPAHTVKKFGVVNRYDLSKEFPVITVRRSAFKGAIDEILWIWQKKSNRVAELGSHVWDSWTDENGTIGKA